MAPIYLYNGGILLRDGKMAVNQNCCCSSSSSSCDCNYINFSSDPPIYTIRITLSGPYGLGCIDTPIEVPLYGLGPCNNNTFEAYFEIDTSLCDPEISCGAVIVTLGLVDSGNSSSSSSCDCDTGQGCNLVLIGYEPQSCDGGIANVELITN